MERDVLAAARDRMRNDYNHRLSAAMDDATQRFEVAQTGWIEASNALDTAKGRFDASWKRAANYTESAEKYEAEAAQLPADSREREEKLELAQKMRIGAAAENQIIEGGQARISVLTAQAEERKAAVAAIDAEAARTITAIETAEEELDRIDDKVRLLDKEQSASASAREARADAEALELEGDTAGATARRQEAARFQAEAEQAARDNAQISIDAKPFMDAGIDIPDAVDVLVAEGPTPAEQLHDRAFALSEQATQLRNDLTASSEAKYKELGVERDREARREFGAQQQAQSADRQVTREEADAKEFAKQAVAQDAKAAAAEKKHDDRGAEEAREVAQSMRSTADVHTERARQAKIEAEELRQEAVAHGQRKVELEAETKAVAKAGSDALAELDKMDDQARLLLEASQKTEQAARLPPDDPRAAALRAEAQKAFDDAARLDVDEAKIKAVLPNAQLQAAAPDESVDDTARADASDVTASADGSTFDDDLVGMMPGGDAGADATVAADSPVADDGAVGAGTAVEADSEIELSNEIVMSDLSGSDTGIGEPSAVDAIQPVPADYGVGESEFAAPPVPEPEPDVAVPGVDDGSGDFGAPATEPELERADEVVSLDEF